MKFYNVFVTTYHNGIEIGTTMGRTLTDKEVNTESYTLTWDNLDKMYKKFGFECKFNIWKFKKGRRVSFFTNGIIPHKHERDVKEWKNKNLDIVIKVTYKERKASIDEMLKWHDAEKAIAYLNEKGLKINEKQG